MEEVLQLFAAASTASLSSLPALRSRLKKVLPKVEFKLVLKCCCDRVLLSTTKEDIATKLIRFFSTNGSFNIKNVYYF